MASAENNGAKTARGAGGKFAAGNPGRPRGARNKANVLMARLEARGGAVIDKLLELAKAGDVAAIRLVADRILPARRDRPVTFSLPPIAGPQDLPAALAAIAAAVAAGELTPGEAAACANLIEKTRQAHETVDLENRILELEARDRERRQ